MFVLVGLIGDRALADGAAVLRVECGQKNGRSYIDYGKRGTWVAE